LLQDLSLWHAVCDWWDLIPAPAFAELFAVNFFPRWLQVGGNPAVKTANQSS
jgi:hypothetical protein